MASRTIWILSADLYGDIVAPYSSLEKAEAARDRILDLPTWKKKRYTRRNFSINEHPVDPKVTEWEQ